jgi:hypothetical protein
MQGNQIAARRGTLDLSRFFQDLHFFIFCHLSFSLNFGTLPLLWRHIHQDRELLNYAALIPSAEKRWRNGAASLPR